MLTGSSVHNQRIERLWRHMHQSVTKLFNRLFYFTEEYRILDPNSDAHIYALHYVYLSRINNSLSAFKNGWNKHSFRTKDAQSPPAIICFRCSPAPTVRLRQSGIATLDFFLRMLEISSMELKRKNWMLMKKIVLLLFQKIHFN